MSNLFESEIQEQCWLVSRDTKGKIRCIDINYTKDEECYIIHRITFQYKGKRTIQPNVIICEGKVKRDVLAQTELQFMSLIKGYKDKGYKEIKNDPDTYSEEELSEIVGEVVTNQAGIIKPMLAKQESKVTKRNIFDKDWMVSPKLDGVRCLMYWDGFEVRSASRGGEHYDAATTHIREYDPLIDFFKAYPSIILDGELYKHSPEITLQQISGAARLEKGTSDTSWIEYWVYDCYNKENQNMSAEDRYNFLRKNFEDISHFVHLNFESKLDIDDGEGSPLYLVHHEDISTESSIWEFHDECVNLGFEGCVVRDPSKPYKPNGRTNSMVKFKNYKSKEFKVIDYELGARGSEDMTFICELQDGRTFKAMPVGDRNVKEEYVENFESKYKNHLAEVTYFNYSDDGIPTQPKLRIFRFDLE